jgi:hypothetical protein
MKYFRKIFIYFGEAFLKGSFIYYSIIILKEDLIIPAKLQNTKTTLCI